MSAMQTVLTMNTDNIEANIIKIRRKRTMQEFKNGKPKEKYEHKKNIHLKGNDTCMYYQNLYVSWMMFYSKQNV